MTARLIDIATQVGVSQATVSRVLNGKSGVADDTRQTVLAAAAELGYDRPVRQRAAGSGLIGLVVPELGNPIFAEFAQHLENLLVQSGHTPLLGTQTAAGISEDQWIGIFLERDAAGILFVSGMHADTHASLDRYRRLRQLDVPVVLVNGAVDDVDAVCISDDDVAAMTLAVGHLSSLGHERLGLAVGPERYVPVIRKVEGFTAAAADNGLVAHVEYSLFTVEGGYAAANALIDAGATAIVCASDLMALGAIRAARTRGLEVPRDLSVVGYDDSPLIAFTDPPLTTLRQSVADMAKAAVRSLLDEIRGFAPPRQHLLYQPELIVRGSTAPAPRAQ